MVVTVFRSRLRPGIEEEMTRLGTRLYELALETPGFVSYKEYMSEDGEIMTLVEFESHETLAAWRSHSEHREAQKLGREKFFSEYRITICDSVRDYSFKGP